MKLRGFRLAKRGEHSLFTEACGETVRKVPKGLALKPQNSANGSKKLYISAEYQLNRGATDYYSRPFSDGLSRTFGE
jgi:hypothetical protein